MFRLNGIAVRRALLAGIVAATCTTPVFAQQQAGLGQSQPNLPDVSLSPRWHVYKLQRDGIDYLQVNDQAGRVRAAFATSHGTFLTLPMGEDQERVSTPQAPKATTFGRASLETIYRQDGATIQVAPLSGGKAAFLAAPQACDKETCGNRQ